MLLSAVSVLVVVQSSSEIPEGLMNNPVLADILKKQFVRFINPVLLLVLKRENRSAELQTMCYLCRYLWIRKAFTLVVCSKSSEPSFPEII